MKNCNKCNTVKPLDGFNKHPRTSDGVDTVCKVCKRAYAKSYRVKNPDKVKNNNRRFREKYLSETNGYAVYYLPEEHYVGFTNNIRTRMVDHRKKNRSTIGYEILCICESPIDAHLYETMFHQRGYNGFQHKY